MAKMTEEARATVILNGQQANATLKEIEASAWGLNRFTVSLMYVGFSRCQFLTVSDFCNSKHPEKLQEFANT